MNVFIHYGCNHFRKEKFNPIRNIPHSLCDLNKPAGGLWGSSVESCFSWKDWCLREEYCTEKLQDFFYFMLADNANLYTINDLKDLLELPILEDMYLDFELISTLYDALWLTDRGSILTHDILVWDCSSIIVMNPNSIIETNDEN